MCWCAHNTQQRTYQSVTMENLWVVPSCFSSSHLVNLLKTSVKYGALATWSCSQASRGAGHSVPDTQQSPTYMHTGHTCLIPVNFLQKSDKVGFRNGLQ